MPAHVLYRWWGPEPVSLGRRPRALSAELAIDLVEGTGAERHPGLIDDHSTPPVRAPHQPDDDPADTGTGESPGYADRFDSGFGVADPMVAAGNQYLIVSDIGGMAFFDKQGEPLSVKNGMPTSMGFKDFFAGFIAKTNDDGSLNESNINLYLGVPKACDSPDYPETYGNRFCVGEFCDIRASPSMPLPNASSSSLRRAIRSGTTAPMDIAATTARGKATLLTRANVRS